MVITSPIGRSTADGDGTTTQFQLGFSISSTSNLPPDEILSVFVFENGVQTKLTFGVDYTVTLNPDTCVFTNPPSASAQITFLLQPEDIQATVYDVAGAFPVKSHEGALDYIQRTNIKQSDILGRCPVLFESAKPQDPFAPVGKGGFVVGVNNDEDAWELLDPLLLGGITPPDVTNPLKFNRALQMVDVDSVTGKAVLDVQPLLYSAPDFTMTGTLEVTDRGKFGGQLSIEGAFIQTIYGETHRLEFLAGSEDIRFDMDPNQQSLAGSLAIFRKNGSYWELTTERKLFVEGTGIAINKILKVQSPQQPYQIGESSLSDDGTIVRSDAPISAKDRLEISGTTTLNTIQFTQTNGDYSILFDLDRTITSGILGFTGTTSTTTIRSVEGNLGDLVLYPNATIDSYPVVASISLAGNATLKDGLISEDAGEIKFDAIVKFVSEDDPGSFKRLKFDSTGTDLKFSINAEGILRAVSDGAGGSEIIVGVLSNIVNWPTATIGSIPYALTNTAGDVVMENSNITYDAGNISVTGNTYLENLYLNSATQGKFSITPDINGDGDVIIDINTIPDTEIRSLIIERSANTYTIKPNDTPLEGYVIGDFQTPNSILKSAADNTALETTLSEDSGSLTVPGDVKTTSIWLGANESEFTDESPTKVKITYKIDQEGFGRFTETAPNEYDFVPVNISGGVGDTSWANPTLNYVPKMNDVANKIMVDSNILNDGDGVTIESPFFIADTGAANRHRINFSPDQNLNVIFGDLTQGGLIVADYTPIVNNATFRAIGTPTGVGDVLYPTPITNRIPKVGNATAKELVNSNLIDTGTLVTIDVDTQIAGELIAQDNVDVDGVLTANSNFFLQTNEFSISQPGNVTIDISAAGVALIDGDATNGWRIYNDIVNIFGLIHSNPIAGTLPVVNAGADGYINSSLTEAIAAVTISKDVVINADLIVQDIEAENITVADTITVETIIATDISTETLEIDSRNLSFSATSEAVELAFEDQINSPTTKIVYNAGVATLTEGYTSATEDTIPLHVGGDFVNSSLTEDTTNVICSKTIRSTDSIEIASIGRVFSLAFSSLLARDYVFDCERDGTLVATRSGNTVVITSGGSSGGGGDVELPIPELNYYTRVSNESPKELASGYLRDDRTSEVVYSEKRGVFLNNEDTAPSLALVNNANRGLMLYQDASNTLEIKSGADRGKVEAVFDFDEAISVTEGIVEAQVRFENGRAIYSLDVIPKAAKLSNVFFDDNVPFVVGGSLTATQDYPQNPTQAIFEEKPSLSEAVYDDISVKRSSSIRSSIIATDTLTLDLFSGSYFEIQLTEDITISVPDLGTNASFATIIIQTAPIGTSSKITWSGNIIWENGEPFTAEFIDPIPPVAVAITFFWTGIQFLAFLSSDFRVSPSGRTIVYQGDFDETYLANHEVGLQYVLGGACFDSSLNQLVSTIIFNDSIFRLLTISTQSAVGGAGAFSISLIGGIVDINFAEDTTISFVPPSNANVTTTTILNLRRTVSGDFDLIFAGALLSDEDSEFLSENPGEVDVFEILYIGQQILVSRVNQRPDPNPPFYRGK